MTQYVEPTPEDRTRVKATLLEIASLLEAAHDRARARKDKTSSAVRKRLLRLHTALVIKLMKAATMIDHADSKLTRLDEAVEGTTGLEANLRNFVQSVALRKELAQ